MTDRELEEAYDQEALRTQVSLGRVPVGRFLAAGTRGPFRGVRSGALAFSLVCSGAAFLTLRHYLSLDKGHVCSLV